MRPVCYSEGVLGGDFRLEKVVNLTIRSFFSPPLVVNYAGRLPYGAPSGP